MTRPQLAQRDSIHLYRFDRQVVAIVTGTKPPHCTGPRLSGSSTNVALNCGCGNCGDPADCTDRYFIVQPVAIPPAARRIEILHHSGRDLVRIENLPAADTGSVMAPSVLGISQDFSLEAAFKDALSKFKPQQLSAPSLVEIVCMGALYGGFSGFSRLFVRVQSSPCTLRNSKGKI